MDPNREHEELRHAREILSLAEELIMPPRCWTRGALARDAAGGAILPRSCAARRWSAVGAMDRARRILRDREANAEPWDAFVSWYTAYGRALRVCAGLAEKRGIVRRRGAHDEDVITAYNDRTRDKRAVLKLLAAARREIDMQLEQQNT
jgi:hypothetical protein